MCIGLCFLRLNPEILLFWLSLATEILVRKRRTVIFDFKQDANSMLLGSVMVLVIGLGLENLYAGVLWESESLRSIREVHMVSMFHILT